MDSLSGRSAVAVDCGTDRLGHTWLPVVFTSRIYSRNSGNGALNSTLHDNGATVSSGVAVGIGGGRAWDEAGENGVDDKFRPSISVVWPELSAGVSNVIETDEAKWLGEEISTDGVRGEGCYWECDVSSVSVKPEEGALVTDQPDLISVSAEARKDETTMR